MARYQLVQGRSSKFWEITLGGNVVTVHFGRIGSAGQSRVKRFETAALAKRHHDALVREKTSEGYSDAKARAKPKATKTSPKPKAAAKSQPKPTRRVPAGSAGNGVATTCAAIETFFEALKADGMEVYFYEIVKPQSAKAIAQIEKTLELALAPDVRAFLARGLRSGSAAVEDGERSGHFGFDWMEAKKIVESTKILRRAADIGAANDPQDPMVKIAREGVALTWSEPQIVVADAVYHFSFRNPLLRVADTFSDFLSAWYASGCFGSGDFKLAWSRAKRFVTSPLTPAKNSWVKAYKRQFPQRR